MSWKDLPSWLKGGIIGIVIFIIIWVLFGILGARFDCEGGSGPYNKSCTTSEVIKSFFILTFVVPFTDLMGFIFIFYIAIRFFLGGALIGWIVGWIIFKFKSSSKKNRKWFALGIFISLLIIIFFLLIFIKWMSIVD